ncbi:YdeI/OmpD-associated family protein [Brachybacterium sp. AOP43-C2-M15]|uniref:YdeI/OmpD-associated family protein n=1 Tax=Brachybacterium sp. AOP43-C2-M15 TaxID=3457661 RepID=UPI004034163A
MSAAELPPPLVIPDPPAWRAWLEEHEDSSDGVWLLMAKKGKDAPTALTYQEALEEALCSGWIDGQRRGHDEHAFRQRFTPRRPRSIWSQRNVEIVARLVADGRMRERGLAEVDLARADGRWERAYPGPATAEAPEDLVRALAAAPPAEVAFARLADTARYSALHPVLSAPNEATRARRITALVEKLGRSAT